LSLDDNISYTLYPQSLSAAVQPGGALRKLTYELHDVRDAVRTLTDVLLSDYGEVIFSRACGRCGRCCKCRTVILSARELSGISRHMGIPEELFRERYTVPAATWNRRDGALALRDGKCIFLETGSSGSCRCAIYPARPSSCREIMPEPERCRRDPGMLLTLVEKLEVGPEGLSCHLASGDIHKIEQKTLKLQDALKRLGCVVRPYLGMKHSELDQISGDAHRVLDWLLSSFEAGKPREMLLPRFLAMKEVVDDIDTHTPLREKNLQDLELLWSKVRHLNCLFDSVDDDRKAVETEGGARQEAPVTICFLPTELSVEMNCHDEPQITTLHYERNSRLADTVREFIEALVGSGDPGLLDVLGHEDPYCVQCGACCGPAYDQEITASDIERIANHLQISEQELREKHMLPGERSWNRRDGLIRKREDEGHEGDCTFLDSISPVESKCRIYSARPQMCRDYQVNNRLCRKKSLLLKGHEHAGNIISCRVADGMVSLTTHHTVINNREPFSIPLKDNDRLLELFSKVKAEVGSILTSEAI